ncbi:MAG TPA: 2-C-methyl-D-erythritol 4-phosphate cytidylyltransferase [Solirubrobacteraceae bacterium]|nr:2-C-methyl-D-erythritol 4-phosphate cytidylyltransferase [Solirubrobacteraceae bacterium]
MAIALILAAGRGERLGARVPKGRVPLGGRPLVMWSIDVLRQLPEIERVIVALPADSGGTVHEWDIAPASPPELLGVPGGATRSESVRLALAAAGPGDPVLVHDAARPLVTVELARHTLAALEAGSGADLDAAIAAAPVTDTIKRAAHHVVTETLDRSDLWAVQTPQVFRRAALERALDVPAALLAQATDDAWLVERCGGRVGIVPSSGANLKVTTEADLQLAELLLARRPA